MAQKLNSVTPDIKPPDIDNPDGSYLDKTVSVTGSPTLAGFANSTYSFFRSLMTFAGFNYNGQVDTTTLSQYFNAFIFVINSTVAVITDALDVRVTQNEDDINTNAGNISTNAGNINTNAGKILATETKTPQSYKQTDTITLVDLALNGVNSVRLAIIDLLSRMGVTEGATGTNSGNISTNAGNISTNSGNISTLQTKTPQSYKTTDNVVFNSVNTDNVALKTKVIDIGAWDMDATVFVFIPHGVDVSKITSIDVMIKGDTLENLRQWSHNSGGLMDINVETVTASSVQLQRRLGGSYDIPDYSSTALNRGTIQVTYKA